MCLATPAKIKSINNDKAIADFGGIEKRISLGILSGVKKGDFVLVHAGFAIGKVEKQQAEDIHRALKELDDAVKNG
jgi:hydrogenase expression/formation protein HypC